MREISMQKGKKKKSGKKKGKSTPWETVLQQHSKARAIGASISHA